eukprot:6642188-Pyramimonas_sp.AAC.1
MMTRSARAFRVSRGWLSVALSLSRSSWPRGASRSSSARLSIPGRNIWRQQLRVVSLQAPRTCRSKPLGVHWRPARG